MIRHTPSDQLTLEGPSHPFERGLSLENRWVKLSRSIPWGALAAVHGHIDGLSDTIGSLGANEGLSGMAPKTTVRCLSEARTKEGAGSKGSHRRQTRSRQGRLWAQWHTSKERRHIRELGRLYLPCDELDDLGKDSRTVCYFLCPVQKLVQVQDLYRSKDVLFQWPP